MCRNENLLSPIIVCTVRDVCMFYFPFIYSVHIPAQMYD